MEYKDTIFLPKTSFEMRANLPLKEPKILEEWDKQKIFKHKLNNEIEKEIIAVEKEIKALQKSSISSINKIATEISEEVIKQIIDSEINKSNVAAIVEDVTKKEMEKHT